MGLGGFFMENKKQSEEIQSRRDFFKKAAKSALPILGAVLLANAPAIVKATEAEPEPMGCNYCSYGCSGTCQGCRGSCRGDCVGNCYQTCYVTCKGYCKGCSGSCEGNCYTGCSGVSN